METRWEQRVSNATLIAKRHGKVDPDRAYTAGLLENIGHLVLDRFLHEAIEEIQGMALSGTDLIEAERSSGSTTWRSGSARPAGPCPTLVEVIRHYLNPLVRTPRSPPRTSRSNWTPGRMAPEPALL